MKKWYLIVILVHLMIFPLSCSFDRNNPLDEEGSNYTPPKITIIQDISNLKNGDTIHFDTITIALAGNREESRFNLKVDNSEWSRIWEPAGVFGFSKLADGKHTLYINSMYSGWERIVSDSLTFYVKTKGYKPEFIIISDTIISLFEGMTITLSVKADGYIPLYYTWIKGKSILKGKTSDSLKINSLSVNDSGSYKCIVTNEYGNDTSRTFIIKHRTYNGIIKGVVSDSSGNNLKDAMVTLSPLNNKVTTDSTGSFAFTSLSKNVYSLQISLSKYHDATIPNVMVNDSETVILQTIKLKIIDTTTYRIMYNGNGNDSGNIPSDTTRYKPGSKIAVAGIGNLSKTGYTFSNWNTKKDGTGDIVSPGDSITVNGNITCFAQWKTNKYTVWFNTTGGNHMDSIFVNYGDTVPLLSKPGKQSYVFSMWCKNSDGTTPWNFSADTIKGNDTLYAKWVIMDVDGNIYTEVKLGNQVWMVENLKVTKYRDKIPIPKMPMDKDYWQPGYCWYNNDSTTYKEPHGALYNWNVIDPANSHKVAPDGWHVPSDTEWTDLVMYLSNNGYNYDESKTYNYIGKSLAATTLWDTEQGEGKIGYELSKNNKSGFSAYPSGQWDGSFAIFASIGKRCYWWSASIKKKADENSEEEIWARCLDYYYEYLETTSSYRWMGLSIRCVRDW